MIKIYNTYSIAGHYLSAIFNDDESAFEGTDSDDLAAFYDSLPDAPLTFDVTDGEPNFQRDDVSGLLADCYNVDLYIPKVKT